jgi:hypothetical protein
MAADAHDFAQGVERPKHALGSLLLEDHDRRSGAHLGGRERATGDDLATE